MFKTLHTLDIFNRRRLNEVALLKEFWPNINNYIIIVRTNMEISHCFKMRQTYKYDTHIGISTCIQYKNLSLFKYIPIFEGHGCLPCHS